MFNFIFLASESLAEYSSICIDWQVIYTTKSVCIFDEILKNIDRVVNKTISCFKLSSLEKALPEFLIPIFIVKSSFDSVR